MRGGRLPFLPAVARLLQPRRRQDTGAQQQAFPWIKSPTSGCARSPVAPRRLPSQLRATPAYQHFTEAAANATYCFSDPLDGCFADCQRAVGFQLRRPSPAAAAAEAAESRAAALRATTAAAASTAPGAHDVSAM